MLPAAPALPHLLATQLRGHPEPPGGGLPGPAAADCLAGGDAGWAAPGGPAADEPSAEGQQRPARPHAVPRAAGRAGAGRCIQAVAAASPRLRPARRRVPAPGVPAPLLPVLPLRPCCQAPLTTRRRSRRGTPSWRRLTRASRRQTRRQRRELVPPGCSQLATHPQALGLAAGCSRSCRRSRRAAPGRGPKGAPAWLPHPHHPWERGKVVGPPGPPSPRAGRAGGPLYVRTAPRAGPRDGPPGSQAEAIAAPLPAPALP